MENFIEVLRVFWFSIPEVGLDAFLVFIAVGLLKAVGVLKEDLQAQMGNLFATWFLTGGASDIVGFSMTAVVAGAYYHLWKFVRPYLVKGLDLIKSKLGA